MTTLRYRNYVHDPDEVWFTISKNVLYDRFQRGRGYRETWSIIGTKFANSNSDLTAQLRKLENAYGVNGGNVEFRDANGAVLWHSIKSGQTFGGVRVKSIEYPNGLQGVWGAGSEFVARRTYRIVLECDFLQDMGILAYKERVVIQGFGGPRQALQGSLIGAVKRYELQRMTSLRIIQEGTIVGDTQYPGLPVPVAPVAVLDHENSMLARHSPKIVNGQYREYQMDWRLVFETAPLVQFGGGLQSVPTILPGNGGISIGKERWR